MTGEVTKAFQCSLAIPEILNLSVKIPRLPYQKRFYNKGHLTLAAEVLEGFAPSVFNRLCEIHDKNNKNGD